MPEPDLGYAVGLEPRDALEYLRARGLGPSASWYWWDHWERAHAETFVVAKALRRDVVGSIREAMDRALAEGRTRREFLRGLEPDLRRLGWWGRRIVVAPDGGAEIVTLGTPYRLRTIYDTNMRVAYAAGAFRRQEGNAESRPIWIYDARDDSRTRPSHAAMDGFAFAHDDPFWESHYPPNGFNCRCRVRAVTEAQARDMGVEVRSGRGHLRRVAQRVGTDKRTGEIVTRPGTEYFYRGPDGRPRRMTPDPGWSYNPGKQGVRPPRSTGPALQGGTPAQSVTPPKGWAEIDRHAALRPADETGWHLHAWDGNIGSPVALAAGRAPALTSVFHDADQTAAFRVVPVRVQMDGFAPGTRAGSTVWRHEYGHHMDHAAVSGTGYYWSERLRYVQAMQRDRDSLGEGFAKADGLDAEALRLAAATVPERARTIAEAANRLGLSRNVFEDFLREHGVFGFARRNGLDLDSDGRIMDVFLYRLMLAVEHHDAAGFLGAAWLGRRGWMIAEKIVENKHLLRWQAARKLLEKRYDDHSMASDLVHALTHGTTYAPSGIDIGWKHHNDYYDQDSSKRGKEVFANLVSLGGSGQSAAAVVSRLLPNVWFETLRGLEEIQ